ncbi:alpha/beta fold hydrolase [Pseudonocardia humida]|uniref:Alpha/beta hydrolase n=1 Tax=Pseudonocardia humida TaxID=2800819 RepID=A0ABT1A3C4_9PSEU|nr:alpha/beta hydrolase [Pseudonocardia humida]MCO1657506.1 alpha/beta hydrolase [Pseudonocardia humida]
MAQTGVDTDDGVRLSVLVEEPERAAVTVVLAHGWTLDTRTWGPVAAGLLRGPRPPRVVRYDHRGHGRSDPAPPETMTIDRLADDLAHVIAATAPDGPLVLAGHSMGGMALMALAERHPAMAARAAGLAFVATASGGLARTAFGLPERGAAVARAVDRRLRELPGRSRRGSMGPPWLLAPALRWLLLGRHPDPLARLLTVRAVAACRPQTVAGFRATLDEHERDTALAAFAGTPTVVLAGDRDRLTPLAAARRITEALPSARLTVFPGAGHMLPVERVPGVVAELDELVRGAVEGAPARQSPG